VKVIIVEDEAIASRRLLRMLTEQQDFDVQVEGVFTSIQETATYLLENKHPEIIFLDIHVADGNSFELFNIINPIRSVIIFTTAYNEYATQAFRKNAVDYLLKPIKKEELQEALGKSKLTDISTQKNLKSAYKSFKNRFLIRLGSKIQIIKTSEIAYIYSENKLSYFVTHSSRKYPSDFKLQDLQDMLDPAFFFRANRQIILSLESIEEIFTYSKSRVKIKLNPRFKEEIVVSTETTPLFKQWLDT
jgi:two-component system LytT family response regulator